MFMHQEAAMVLMLISWSSIIVVALDIAVGYRREYKIVRRGA